MALRRQRVGAVTAQARIAAEPWADGIAVYLLRKGDSITVIERPNHINGPAALDPVTPGLDPGPSLRLSDDMALQLLDALARHYRHATDTTHQRRDYDAERGRVDRLIGFLAEAHRLQVDSHRSILRVQNQRLEELRAILHGDEAQP